ncbi:MAG TPA: 50S ribosomal protein L3 [Candidatus Aenigmarchaeota archaeon]|nr:50S ribosomal protein L3 [Candidatus Aenigmarchaeota archaeon]
MPRTHKPRAGSLQFCPRKRAKRIYPNIRSYPKVDEVKPLAFAGYKAGMTRVFFVDNKKDSPTYGQTVSHAVTVLETTPLFVLGYRAYANKRALTEVYAEEIPKDIKKYLKAPKGVKKSKTKDVENFKEIRLIVCTQPRKSGLGKKTPEVFELPLGGKPEEQKKFAMEKLGKELKVEEVFKEGEFVDVIAVTKGKGYQGVVKRYGVKIRGRKDEQHHRQIGVIGTEGVAHVLYTIPQPGQHGFHRRTEFNKQIYKIGTNPEEVNPKGGFVNYGIVKTSYVLLKGSVPGPKKRLIFMRAPMRAHKKGYPVEIQKIDLESQQ